MTLRNKQLPSGQPKSNENGGSFGSAPPNTDAPAGIVTPPAPTPAADKLNSLVNAQWDLEKATMAAAVDAIRETLATAEPEAKSATFIWYFNDGGKRQLNFSEIHREVAGAHDDDDEFYIEDEGVIEELNDFASHFTDRSYVMKNTDFTDVPDSNIKVYLNLTTP